MKIRIFIFLLFIAGYTMLPARENNIKLIKLSDYAPQLTATTDNNTMPESKMLERMGKTFGAMYYCSDNKMYTIDTQGKRNMLADLNAHNLTRPTHEKWSNKKDKLLLSLHPENPRLHQISLYLLNMNGSLEEIEKGEPGISVFQADWSYNDQWITFIKSYSKTVTSSVFIKNFETGKTVEIDNGVSGNPIWFNNSLKLLYKNSKPKQTSPYPETSLILYDVISNKKTLIFKGYIGMIYPIISPDDSLIIIYTYDRFIIIDIEGNQVKNLELDGSNHTWSPDCNVLAYTKAKFDIHGSNVERHLWIMDMETEEKRNLTPYSKFIFEDFIWLDNSTIILE